jgi:hypothetical protein
MGCICEDEKKKTLNKINVLAYQSKIEAVSSVNLFLVKLFLPKLKKEKKTREKIEDDSFSFQNCFFFQFERGMIS